MRTQHFVLEKDSALKEMRRASQEMDFVQRVLNDGPDECDLMVNEEEEQTEDPWDFPGSNVKVLKKRYDDAEKDHDIASSIHENAENQLKASAASLDAVFLGTHSNLERLSRYETTIERRLRNAMHDLERVQATREARAAEAATVIDVTDQDRDES